jgi:hypothetical protein
MLSPPTTQDGGKKAQTCYFLPSPVEFEVRGSSGSMRPDLEREKNGRNDNHALPFDNICWREENSHDPSCHVRVEFEGSMRWLSS